MSRPTDAARQFVQYHERVLSVPGLIAYWMLDEKSGAVAYDLVSGRVAGAQNGAHVGVTLGQPGIGDGRTSPLYDGVNDFTNVFTAALAAVFDGSEGTIALWARVANAGVWTDGNFHHVVRFQANGTNFITIRKTNVNNQFHFRRTAGGANEDTYVGGMTTVDWFHCALTWSETAGQRIAYLNGAIQGVPIATNAWTGGAITRGEIGGDSFSANLWSGTLAHGPVWDRALSADEVQPLYRARWA